MKNFRKNSIGLLLLFLLCIPMISQGLVSKKTFSDLENRVLTSTITWDEEMLQSGVLADRVEAFVQDQFPLRDTFVNLKSNVVYLLGRKENNGVYLGKEGYLFGKTPDQSKIFMDNLEAIKSLAENLDHKIIVMSVPSSGLIYEEKLPFGVDWKEKETFLKFNQDLEKSAKILDLPTIFDGHKENNIYFKTDHHWTPYGAYLAYEAFMKEISLSPIALENFEEKTVDGFYGTYYSKFRGNFVSSEPFTYYDFDEENLKIEYAVGEDKERTLFFEEFLEERDKYKMFLGGNDPMVTVENPEALYNEKILVLKDSYANAMTPYLAKTFIKIHLIDLRYYNLSLKDYIEKEDFDRVILLYGMDSYLEQSQLRNLGY